MSGTGLSKPNFAKPRAQRLYSLDAPAEVVFSGDGRLVSWTAANGVTCTFESMAAALARMDAQEKAGYLLRVLDNSTEEGDE